MNNSETKAFLTSTSFIDSDHPTIITFAERFTRNASSEHEKVIAIYRAVRDEIRYDPYQFDLSQNGFKASATLEKGYGWCVPKSAVLTAACRAAGIPAKMGFADVRNHLSTRRLKEFFGSDTFYWHSYTSILINGVWLKATPAFDLNLCERINLAPLEFDGYYDSIFHPFDQDGNLHMEYVNYRGEYDDLPYNEIIECYKEKYPKILKQSLDLGDNFHQELEDEYRDNS